MTTKLTDEVRAFLEQVFPGASIDDAYYFVSIEPRTLRRVKDDPFSFAQRVADSMTKRPCWLIEVGADPRSFIRTFSVEERTVVYSPDWNMQQKLSQWIAAVQAGRVDLHAMLTALDSPSALVFIDPDRKIVFDAGMRRIHAPSEAHMNDFLAGIEDCVEAV